MRESSPGPVGKRRRSRRSHAARGDRADAVEQIEIRTEDGRALRADVREPPRAELKGVALLSHAMFARKSEFERPEGRGLARLLVARGWRTIAFDFRGHGDSGPGAADGATWTYDDLVLRDMPAVVASARDRAGSLPVVVVGHSLGGHVSVASQGLGRLGADALVCVAANLWVHSLEPSLARWAAKRATMEVIARICARRGYFPARALRLGSDDEASAYLNALVRFSRTGVWASEDGVYDYERAAKSVKVPVMQVASDGDRLNCRVACAERFLAWTGGTTAFERIKRTDDGRRPPAHMEIVTGGKVDAVWGRVADWMRDVTR